MRSKSLVLIALGLMFLLTLGCASKPADETAAAEKTEGAAAGTESAAKTGGSGSGVTRAANKSAAAKTITLPEGTVLAVRLDQTLGSKTSNAGDAFTATLSEPIEIDGATVIPSGATATGTVVDAKPLGRFKGGAVLQIQLTQVEVNGKSYKIDTESVTQAKSGKGKRTAAMIGGGAGAGAIIGGIAGGGKGAAIGAAIGAGAGTAGAAFTGNKDIVLPAETALNFRLTAPATI